LRVDSAISTLPYAPAIGDEGLRHGLMFGVGEDGHSFTPMPPLQRTARGARDRDRQGAAFGFRYKRNPKAGMVDPHPVLGAWARPHGPIHRSTRSSKWGKPSASARLARQVQGRQCRGGPNLAVRAET
jgi:hypothetical protein